MKMNPVFIPIGFQDTPTIILDNLKLRYKKLPFDNMLSTPEFIYTIIKLIVVDKMEAEEIVDKHFFCCDKRVSLIKPENYAVDKNGKVLFNSKYNVCFPNNTLNDRESYVKKIRNLKKLLKDRNNYIYFLFVSVPSNEKTNYTIDGKQVIKNLYYHVNELDEILSKVLYKYKIIVFDTKKELPLKKKIKECVYFFEIEPKKTKEELLPEIVQKLSISIIPHVENDINRLVPGYIPPPSGNDIKDIKNIEELPCLGNENDGVFGEGLDGFILPCKVKKSETNIEFNYKKKPITNNMTINKIEEKSSKKEKSSKIEETNQDSCVIC